MGGGVYRVCVGVLCACECVCVCVCGFESLRLCMYVCVCVWCLYKVFPNDGWFHLIS